MEDEDIHKQVEQLRSTVSQLDKDVAIIKVEMKGVHVEVGQVKKELKIVAELGQENKNLLIEIYSKFSGAVWVLATIPVIMGIIQLFFSRGGA